MNKNHLKYIIILILIPVFVVSIYVSGEKEINKFSEEEQEISNNNSKDIEPKEKVFIKVSRGNDILELELEEYVMGVVAGEMPASFEIEALKAQAIASRTYAMYKILNNNNSYDVNSTVDDQVYITEQEMKEKWKDEFEYYYNKVKLAVTSTEDQIMKKNNKVFKAYYFAMSNGYTESSEAVFGEKITESVESPWDNNSLNKFIVTVSYTKDEMVNLLKINTNLDEIKIIKRDNTNRVEELSIDGVIFTGIKFRKLLNLRSTDFDIEESEGIYNVTTRGYGHGVGMSQYGANGMAKDNYNYQQILNYFYQNIEITTI